MVLVGIRILPRPEVLDVQGRAIAETLSHQGHEVEACQYGKFIQLKLQTKTEKEALDQARKIAEGILCNSLVETYELEVLSKN